MNAYAEAGVGRARPGELADSTPAALRLRDVASFALPFALVVYLALEGGGYDAIVRGQVGLAIWWLVLVGSALGVLPLARVGPRGWIALGLLATLAGWTALALLWTDSTERTLTELTRTLSYLGVLLLAVTGLARRSARPAVAGIAAGIALIAGLSVLSRIQPGWFPENDAVAFLPREGRRLNYPLNYWNGLAALMALGIPLLVALATSARTTVVRSAAAACLPLVGLCSYLTLSRGGAVAIGAGLAVGYFLAPNRLSQLGTLAVAGGGAAIVVLSAAQREAFADGAATAAASAQADEMVGVLVVVCAGVALLQAGIALVGRHSYEPGWLRRSRRFVARAGALVVAGVALGIAAGGLPSSAESRWEEFKNPQVAVSEGQSRFDSAGGRGRYQYWESAGRSQDANPVTGTGPGTYEFWWNRDGNLPGFIRDAHSLYMETFAELGLVGLVLLAAFLLLVLGTGVERALRGRRSPWIAAATAGGAAFCASASVDWVWELAVLPAAFMVLAAAVLVSSDRSPRRQWPRGRRLAARAALAVLAAVVLATVAVPLSGASALRDSRDAAARGDMSTALRKARDAERVQPYAAGPKLQQALVLEATGALDQAAAAGRAAVDAEPLDWRNWLILGRIDAERGQGVAAVRSYRRARSLNPRARLFIRPTASGGP